MVLQLPCPDPLQRALEVRDRCPLVCLCLGGAAEATHGSQAAVAVGVSRAVVAVGRVPVVAVKTGAVSRRGGVRTSMTRHPILNQNWNGDAPWRGRAVLVLPHRFQGLVLPLALALVAAVLEPDFYLVTGELQGVCQVLAFEGGHVALLLEAPLQLEDLRLRKEDPGSPAARLLLHLPLRPRQLTIRGLFPGHLSAALCTHLKKHESVLV